MPPLPSGTPTMRCGVCLLSWALSSSCAAADATRIFLAAGQYFGSKQKRLRRTNLHRNFAMSPPQLSRTAAVCPRHFQVRRMSGRCFPRERWDCGCKKTCSEKKHAKPYTTYAVVSTRRFHAYPASPVTCITLILYPASPVSCISCILSLGLP